MERHVSVITSEARPTQPSRATAHYHRPIHLTMTERPSDIPRLARTGHSGHCTRCLTGLPFSLVTVESSK